MSHLTHRGTSVSVTNSEATSVGFKFSDSDGGRFIVSALSGATTLTWYESIDGVTYYPAKLAGVALTTAIALNTSDMIPASLNASAYIKAVADAGTATLLIVAKQMSR